MTDPYRVAAIDEMCEHAWRKTSGFAGVYGFHCDLCGSYKVIEFYGDDFAENVTLTPAAHSRELRETKPTPSRAWWRFWA